MTEIKVPTTGNAGEPAVISEWKVAVGDSVAKGDVLATLETAKASVDVDAPVDGVVLALRFDEGDEAAEHEVLLVVGEPGDRIDDPPEDPAPSQPAAQASTGGSVDTPPAEVPARPAPASSARGGRISISPRARRLAAERGLDIEQLTGSGPFGRIVIADIVGSLEERKAARQAAPAADTSGSDDRRAGRVVPVRGARKITAQRMHASLRDSAQVTLTRYAVGDALFSYAARLKEVADQRGTARIGVNDLILFAVARTVGRHPAANSWFSWDGITQFDHVDLGFAVDSPQALLVPVLRDAQSLTLAQLADQAHRAIARARDGKTSADEMDGGTFTVSNLGGAGIHWFTPVLNPPQTCILGVGAAHRAYPEAPAQLPLSLTFDHRAIDGAAAAALLADVAQALEQIDTLAAF